MQEIKNDLRTGLIRSASMRRSQPVGKRATNNAIPARAQSSPSTQIAAGNWW
jgi:hypothetical protein